MADNFASGITRALRGASSSTATITSTSTTISTISFNSSVGSSRLLLQSPISRSKRKITALDDQFHLHKSLHLQHQSQGCDQPLSSDMEALLKDDNGDNGDNEDPQNGPSIAQPDSHRRRRVLTPKIEALRAMFERKGGKANNAKAANAETTSTTTPDSTAADTAACSSIKNSTATESEHESSHQNHQSGTVNSNLDENIAPYHTNGDVDLAIRLSSAASAQAIQQIEQAVEETQVNDNENVQAYGTNETILQLEISSHDDNVVQEDVNTHSNRSPSTHYINRFHGTTNNGPRPADLITMAPILTTPEGHVYDNGTQTITWHANIQITPNQDIARVLPGHEGRTSHFFNVLKQCLDALRNSPSDEDGLAKEGALYLLDVNWHVPLVLRIEAAIVLCIYDHGYPREETLRIAWGWCHYFKPTHRVVGLMEEIKNLWTAFVGPVEDLLQNGNPWVPDVRTVCISDGLCLCPRGRRTAAIQD